MSDTPTLYQSSVPVIERILSNLEHLLSLGAANAKDRGIELCVFTNARLAPDMASLAGQVGILTSLAKAGPYRLSGQTPPSYPDLEPDYGALLARIALARADIAKVTADQINNRESESFSLKMGPTTRDFTSLTYLNEFLLPNIYFHLTTAYNILRHNGVPLGKIDYFGGPGAA